jgi:glycopeptide antibiotics resistance protein
MKAKTGSPLSPQIAGDERSFGEPNYSHGILLDGVVAGLLGALAIAVCFLFVDLSEGQPLSTPAVLSALLFHAFTSSTQPTLGATLVYTVLHFAAFALAGLIMAWLVRATRRASMLALFAVIFLAASETFFVLLLTGSEASSVPALSRWSLLVANLMGVGVMLAYFFARNPGLGGSLLGSWSEVVSEGIVAGLIGGLVVALWFFLFDVSTGQPFQTPAILGAAIVGNNAAAAMASVSPELVFIYTVLHFAAFMLFGILVATLFAHLKRTEVLVAGLFLVFLLFELFFVGFMTMIDEQMLQVLRRWKIEVGNLLASGSVLAFLLARNRDVRAKLVHGWKGLQEVMEHMVPKPPAGH